MSDDSRSRSAPDSRVLEQLLVEALDGLSEEGSRAPERICAEHPDYAEALRERLALLSELDLLDEDEPAIASLPGDFRVLRSLGRGGMGEVFLAEQRSLGRLVAVKVFHERSHASAQRVERFRREARALAALDHPNVVRVHEFREERGRFLLVMEYVAGRSLDEVLEERRARVRPDADEVLRWSTDIAAALAAVHEAELVHRDVKPSNIRIATDGRAVLLDFGLARHLGEEALSRTGAFLGSPNYAAPEQVSASIGAIRPPTDVYSLGLTIYEALTGWIPFAAETTEQVFHGILHLEPAPLRQLAPWATRDLDTVVAHCLEKQPRHRYPDAKALHSDLEALREGRAVSVRPVSPLVRVARWARRRPSQALAASLGAIAFLTLAVLLSQWPRIQDARELRRQQRIEGTLEQAFLELGLQRYDEAERRFAAVLEEEAEQLEARCGRVFATLLDGDLEGARRVLEGWPSTPTEAVALRALRTDVEDPVAGAELLRELAGQAHEPLDHYLLGHLEATSLADAQAPRRALEHYRRAVRFAERPRALYQNALVTAAVHAGELELAAEEYEVMRRHWPRHPLTFACGGVLHLGTDPERAVEDFGELARGRPDCAYTRNNQAIALRFVGRNDEAHTILVHACERAPESMAEDRAVLWLNRAGVEVALGAWEDAAASLEQARSLDPGFEDAVHDAAVLALARGELADARRLVDAFPLDAEHAGPLRGLAARLALHAGEFDRARRLAEQALQIDPWDSPARVTRAFLAGRAGDPAGALRDAEAVEGIEQRYRWLADRMPGWAEASQEALPFGASVHERARRAHAAGEVATAAAAFDQLRTRAGWAEDPAWPLTAATCWAEDAERQSPDPAAFAARARDSLDALELALDGLSALEEQGLLTAAEFRAILVDQILLGPSWAPFRPPRLDTLPADLAADWSALWEDVQLRIALRDSPEIRAAQDVVGQVLCTVFGL